MILDDSPNPFSTSPCLEDRCRLILFLGLRSGRNKGDPCFNASSQSVMNGSTSQSISSSLIARSQIASLSATTRAPTGCPIYWAVPGSRSLTKKAPKVLKSPDLVGGLIFISSGSSYLNMALTPGRASALRVSIFLIFACGCGER